MVMVCSYLRILFFIFYFLELHSKTSGCGRFNGGDSRSTGLASATTAIPVQNLRWRRVLLKVSGEALAGDGSQNIDPKVHWFACDLRCMLFFTEILV